MTRTLLAAGLLLAGAGVFIQFVTGVPGFPPIPPGPIVLIGAGLVVAFVHRPGAVIVGAFAAVFVSVGGVIATIVNPVGGIIDRLVAVEEIGPFLGTAAQVIGLVLALIGGTAATLHVLRRRGMS